MIFSMKPALRLAFVAIVSGAFLAPLGSAQAGGSKPTGGEIRIGGAYHGYASAESGTVDVSVDALLPAFDLGKPLSGDAFSLHPQIGVDLNTQGKTNAAFAGFAAVVRLPANFKIEADLGGSVNDGNKTSDNGSGRSELGCNALFREAFGIGYQITPDVSLMAFAEHMSNANLCSPNNGITNFGLKFGYAF